MHRYHVTRIQDEGCSVSLRDSAGQFHVARVMTEAPSVGSNLAGSVPGLGYRVLLCVSTNRAFRLTFEQINCQPPSMN